MKTVTKPWGQEVWFELNDKYCLKRIHLNGDHQTSFQYHTVKLETSYVLSGQVEVQLENGAGEIEKRVLSSGDVFTVQPGKRHRVRAITDAVYLEVSTPEVDDIVRIQDDFGRSSGRIESEHSGGIERRVQES